MGRLGRPVLRPPWTPALLRGQGRSPWIWLALGLLGICLVSRNLRSSNRSASSAAPMGAWGWWRGLATAPRWCRVSPLSATPAGLVCHVAPSSLRGDCHEAEGTGVTPVTASLLSSKVRHREVVLPPQGNSSDVKDLGARPELCKKARGQGEVGY